MRLEEVCRYFQKLIENIILRSEGTLQICRFLRLLTESSKSPAEVAKSNK